eukprot:4722265-Prymnesium_polylepis.1
MRGSVAQPPRRPPRPRRPSRPRRSQRADRNAPTAPPLPPRDDPSSPVPMPLAAAQIFIDRLGHVFCGFLKQRKEAPADSKDQPARMLVLDCLGNLVSASARCRVARAAAPATRACASPLATRRAPRRAAAGAAAPTRPRRSRVLNSWRRA